MGDDKLWISIKSIVQQDYVNIKICNNKRPIISFLKTVLYIVYSYSQLSLSLVVFCTPITFAIQSRLIYIGLSAPKATSQIFLSDPAMSRMVICKDKDKDKHNDKDKYREGQKNNLLCEAHVRSRWGRVGTRNHLMLKPRMVTYRRL